MFRLTTLLFAAAVATGAAAETFVVTPDGPTTIQMAINDCYLSGDIIELTDGVFTGPGNRDLSFLGKDIIVRSQSGDPTTCIIDSEGSDQDFHRAFVFENAEGPDAVVEGLTMRNGYHGWAGGIYSAVYCSPTIRNCRFIANKGTEGGGLCTMDAATIENCWFEGNVSTDHGGGASAAGNMGWASTFIGCTFVNNTAGEYGGAFRC